MSYLNPLRLAFAGRFQAAPSTVNNDPLHFDNSTFKPSYQQRGKGTKNGWWNPRGDGAWRFVDCKVTAATASDGSPVDPSDPVLSALIADSDRAAPAKLVDLDPMQQMVSTIWGLEMRICDPTGATRVRGAFEPAAFFDLWARAQAGGAGGDMAMGAMFQSTLTDVAWEAVDDSPFLAALRDAQQGDLLSVKFMVDGYGMSATSDNFTYGRVVGSIGPAEPSEPLHMVRGRQFVVALNGISAPNGINSCTAVVDAENRKVLLDLGNALPTDSPGGEISDLGALALHAGEEPLCAVPYGGSGWYESTAGIVSLPVDGTLSDDQLEQIGSQPLSLYLAQSDVAAAVEAPLYVRADQFVFRLSPGDSAVARLVATNLGEPYPNAEVTASADPTQLQPVDKGPPVAVPADAIQFPETVPTGPDGVAELTISASDPGNPRGYIDGQVYGIAPTLSDAQDAPQDIWNFVSILVWDAFEADTPPTWYGSAPERGLQPIFQQYANLYPIMDGFLDLSDYESVCANVPMLRMAFGLDPRDSNSMPVTRDLSPAKRAAILFWLENPGADGKPLLGTPPPAEERVGAVDETPAEPVSSDGLVGGKTAAMARVLKNRS